MKNLSRLSLALFALLISAPVVAQDTSALQNLEVITADNAAQLTQLDRLGGGTVNDLAWSPDGTKLAVATDIGLWLYDAADFGAAPLLFNADDALVTYGVAFSPDSRLLATGSFAVVRLWDAQTGEMLAEILGQQAEVREFAFTPDGSKLISGGRLSSIEIIDMDYALAKAGAANCTVTANGNANIRNAPSTNASRTEVLSGGSSAAVLTRSLDSEGMMWWRLESDNAPIHFPYKWVRADLVNASEDCNRVPLVIKAPQDENASYEYYSEFALTSDGKTLYTGNYGGNRDMIWRWDVETGQNLGTLTSKFPRPSDPGAPLVSDMSLSLDDTFLAVYGYWQQNGQVGTGVRIWNLYLGTEDLILDDRSDWRVWPYGDMPFHHDSAIVALPGSQASKGVQDGVLLWDVQPGQAQATLCCHNMYLISLAFSPDGQRLASVTPEGELVIWDMTAEKEAYRLTHLALNPTPLAFLPDENLLVDAGTGCQIIVRDVFSGDEQTARICPLDSEGFGDDVFNGTVAVSADGSLLADFTDLTLAWWDIENASRLGNIEFEPSDPRFPRMGLAWYDAAFSPDNQLLAYTDENLAVHLIDVQSGDEQAVIPVDAQRIAPLTFSPDSKLLVIVRDESPNIDLYDTTTGQRVKSLKAERNLHWYDANLVFNIDGALLVCPSGRNIYIWDVETGRQEVAIQTVDPVYSVALSPDGALLAYGTTSLLDAKTLHLWDLSAGELLVSLEGHTRLLDEVHFNAEGNLLVTRDRREGTWRFWGVRGD
jgi:WD40 repeat protein